MVSVCVLKNMPHISTKKLANDVVLDISDRLLLFVVNARDKRTSAACLRALLSATERLMLAKRLAAVMMLAEGVAPFRVHRLLRLSTSTVARFQEDITCGRFDFVTAQTHKSSRRKQFWKDLETLLAIGMPPIVGRGRWRFLHEIDRLDRRRSLRKKNK